MLYNWRQYFLKFTIHAFLTISNNVCVYHTHIFYYFYYFLFCIRWNNLLKSKDKHMSKKSVNFLMSDMRNTVWCFFHFVLFFFSTCLDFHNLTLVKANYGMKYQSSLPFVSTNVSVRNMNFMGQIVYITFIPIILLFLFSFVLFEIVFMMISTIFTTVNCVPVCLTWRRWW